MISPSRLIKWLNGVEENKFRVYSPKDKTFNEDESPKFFEDYEPEVELSNEKFHGILDFCKRKDGKVIEWIECKVRSNWEVDKWMLLQCLIYEEITQCENWSLCLINRKVAYEKIHYDREYIMVNYKYMVEKCMVIINYVKDNFNELNYLLARNKIEDI